MAPPRPPARARVVAGPALCESPPADPAASGDLAAVASKAAPAFNRLLSRRDSATDLPAGFSQRDCASLGGADVCIFARSGGCDASTAAPFVLNDVLVRVDR